MTWAVFNIHSPAAQLNENGTISHDRGPDIQMPEPLFTKPSREEAEEERQKRLSRFSFAGTQRRKKVQYVGSS